MKKTNVALFLAAITTSVSSMAAVTSSSGTLTINGLITEPTCVATISSSTGTATNAGTNSLTLTLPTVATSAFSGTGSVAGVTPFTITLKQTSANEGDAGEACPVVTSGTTTLTPNLWFDNTDSSITTAGNLTNEASDADGTAQVQLLNDKSTVINLLADQSSQVSSTYDASTGELGYTAQYLAAAASVGAQTVTTAIGFNVVYK